MSLQNVMRNYVSPSSSDFQDLLTHLEVHHPNQNMHLRDIQYKNKKRTLRFLHMTKLTSNNKIEGHIAGPNNLTLHYELELNAGNVLFHVHSHTGNYKDLYRIAKNLNKWLIKRMRSEQVIRQKIRVKYSKNEFYLRRSTPGMPITHRNIQNGLAQMVFTQIFANTVGRWGFEILNP
ncbi:hypothetical protein ACJVC5_10855 [Peredibacter sp. HCB2-198]|uniref:hypothetical protein n=1 Tax=Peredibacter sp. HCB2-198 TaxID=3383025 RepID=UPI0038B62051